jgi:hypothetical protein
MSRAHNPRLLSQITKLKKKFILPNQKKSTKEINKKNVAAPIRRGQGLSSTM